MDVGLLLSFYILLPYFSRMCVVIWTSGPLTNQDEIVTVFFLQEAIMEPLDHKNLDKDVPYFAEVVRWVVGAPHGIGCRVKERASRLSPTSGRAALIHTHACRVLDALPAFQPWCRTACLTVLGWLPACWSSCIPICQGLHHLLALEEPFGDQCLSYEPTLWMA